MSNGGEDEGKIVVKTEMGLIVRFLVKMSIGDRICKMHVQYLKNPSFVQAIPYNESFLFLSVWLVKELGVLRHLKLLVSGTPGSVLIIFLKLYV